MICPIFPGKGSIPLKSSKRIIDRLYMSGKTPNCKKTRPAWKGFKTEKEWIDKLLHAYANNCKGKYKLFEIRLAYRVLILKWSQYLSSGIVSLLLHVKQSIFVNIPLYKHHIVTNIKPELHSTLFLEQNTWEFQPCLCLQL
jgi:hypothetical protein